jgi:YVTN family beta-propeller protein
MYLVIRAMAQPMTSPNSLHNPQRSMENKMNTFGNSRFASPALAFITAATLSLIVGCGVGAKATAAAAVTPPPAGTISPTIPPPTPAVPYGVVFNAATNLYYIANGPADSVSVMDGATNKLTATIAVGVPVSLLAINTTTNTIYGMGQTGDEFLSVINGASNKVTTTVGNFGTQVSGIAVNSVTNKIYIVDAAAGQNYNVTTLDGATNAVVGELQVGGNASAVAVNTITNTVYVTNTNSLIVIDGATNLITATVQATPATGSAPAQATLVGTSAVAVDETTNTIYVADTAGLNSVSVINGATNIVTAIIEVGNDPMSIAVNSLSHKIYVANHLDKSVTVIDGPTNTSTATISLTDYPENLTINTATNVIYVLADESIIMIDGTTNEVAQ